MERRRNRTPGRFLRRNKPYFLLALTLVLLTAAVIFGVKIMRELRTPAQPSVPASVQEPVTPAQPETDGSEQEQEPEQTAPAIPGTTVYLAEGRLRAVYDPDVLQMDSSTEGLDSFLPVTDGQLARIDVQKLNTSRELLKTAELERICIGAVQAYYYTAPATEDILLTVSENTDEVYDAQLSAPAYNGAPKAAARVRLLQLDGAVQSILTERTAPRCSRHLIQSLSARRIRHETSPDCRAFVPTGTSVRLHAAAGGRASRTGSSIRLSGTCAGKRPRVC